VAGNVCLVGGDSEPAFRGTYTWGLSHLSPTVLLMEGFDRSVVEAASWRLASELVRRHPTVVRLIRGHPGGGQSNCLWLLPLIDDKGDVRLNRVGTIQVLERFDGRSAVGWRPTEWSEYLFAKPRGFLDRLEREAGLPTPSPIPGPTPRTLTYRVLAAIAASAFKSVHPIEIQQGFVDSSGYDAGQNPSLDGFPIDPERLRSQPDDFFGEARYRFWIVVRDEVPVLAVDQADAFAWTPDDSSPLQLMGLYERSQRHLLTTALEVLCRVDNTS
jgi:hypothetical protein